MVEHKAIVPGVWAWVWSHHLPASNQLGTRLRESEWWPCAKTKRNYSHGHIATSLVPRPSHTWTRLDCNIACHMSAVNHTEYVITKHSTIRVTSALQSGNNIWNYIARLRWQCGSPLVVTMCYCEQFRLTVNQWWFTDSGWSTTVSENWWLWVRVGVGEVWVKAKRSSSHRG